MAEERRELVRCDCHAHMLEVSSWDNEPDMTYLAMWSYGTGGDHWKFWPRVKIAWKLLRTGRGHADQLCLCDEQKIKLVKALLPPKTIIDMPIP